MSWGEAARLVVELLRDPATHLSAAVLGWDYPVSAEWLVLTNLRNGFMRAHFKDPDPWPVPWPTAADASRIGAASEQVLTQEQIDQVLREMAGR